MLWQLPLLLLLLPAPPQERRPDPTARLREKIANLESRDDRVRSDAVDALVRAGRPAISLLVPKLEDRAHIVRRGVVQALAIGKDAVPALVATLRRGPSLARRTAAMALRRIGDGATHALLEVLRAGGDAKTLHWAGWALRSHTMAAVPTLLAAVRGDNFRAREAASTALGRLGARVVPQILTLLKDESALVRREAAGILGQIGPEAAPATSSLLQALADRNWMVHPAATVALARIGWAAIPGLERTLSESRRGDHKGRHAAEALARIGRPAVDALRRIVAEGEPHARELAQGALEKIGR